MRQSITLSGMHLNLIFSSYTYLYTPQQVINPAPLQHPSIIIYVSVVYGHHATVRPKYDLE
jgi:hypothetical protein